MISFALALDMMLAEIARLPSETCAVGEAAGRTLAGPVISAIDLPSFDHAAMDGYALSSKVSMEAGSEHDIHGSQAAGDDVTVKGAPSGRGIIAACEIMTGARLPDGLDAVVAVERTDCLTTDSAGAPTRIRLCDNLRRGENVRYAGSDVARGEAVLREGTRIESSHIMLLAALGVAAVEVVRRPRLAVICTGKELQSDPTQPLAVERIHNSNGPYLAAALVSAGALVLTCETVDDTATTYADALKRAVLAGVDMVISTGAVSMGRFDFVPDTLRQFKARVLFHKVAIRPGKPLLCAKLDNGPMILALPGTPMAVAAGMRFFVTPVLFAMTGQGSEPAQRAVLAAPQRVKAGLRHFLRGSLHRTIEGQLHATVSAAQEPFRIRPFADADAWIVLSEEAGDLEAGALVEVVSLEPGQRLYSAPRH